MSFAFSLSPALSRWERELWAGSTRALPCGFRRLAGIVQWLLTTKALGGAPKAARGGACAPHSFSFREKVAAGRMRVKPRMFLMATV